MHAVNTQYITVKNQRHVGKILCIPLLSFLLIACDETTQLERTLRFDGALSKDCLMQSAVAIDAEFEEFREDLETTPFPFEFSVKLIDSGRSFYTWERAEVQSLHSSYFVIGPSSSSSELLFCTNTTEYFNSVTSECMLQPGTTEVVETRADFRCP